MTDQPQAATPPTPPQSGRMASGFASLREALSYLMGAATLGYGVVAAPTEKQMIVIGAGLALIGAPIVGGVFDKKV